MFYHQKVARVRVFADIQSFALCAHCVHGIPKVLSQHLWWPVNESTWQAEMALGLVAIDGQ